MEFYKEGEKSKAVCSTCKKVNSTTFKVRTADIRDGASFLSVPSVLVGVCDDCDTVVTVPQQSFAAVAEVKKKAEKGSLEVRLCRHELDILNNSITNMGIELTSDLVPQLLKYYIVRLRKDKKTIKRMRTNLKSDLFDGSARKTNRLSIKINVSLSLRLAEFLKEAGLTKICS